MKHLISVLVPTYNDFEGFLNVLNFYSKDDRVKIIISDDSSNVKIRNAIKKKCIDENIEYLEGPRSLPIINWNNLMQFIDTPYFVINHHDEYPNNLLFLDLLESGKIGLLILPITSYSGGKPPHKIYSWQQKLFSRICLISPNASFNMLLSPTASLIVNSKAKDVFFDLNLKWFVDCDWYYRVFFRIKKLKLKIKFCNFSRIISTQSVNSISSSISGSLKKQIYLEKPILNKKQLIPNKFISFAQYFLLALILAYTKAKQILLSKSFFIFHE